MMQNFTAPEMKSNIQQIKCASDANQIAVLQVRRMQKAPPIQQYRLFS